MFGLHMQELLIILVLVLIFFGVEKIPQLARSLGKGMSEFRRAQRELKNEIMADEAASPAAAAEPAAPPRVACPHCQGLTAAGALYCSQCGQKIFSQPVCGVCQRSLLPEEKFCPNCGQPTQQA